MPRKTKPKFDGTKWRHYKGGEYIVFGTATDSFTNEMLILYKDSDGKAWARTAAEWFDVVDTDDGVVSRFEEVKE